MPKSSAYISRTPDADGIVRYSADEDRVWHDLVSRQLPLLEGRACDEYIRALDVMDFPTDRIPQLDEVSAVLHEHTGWTVTPVPALIDFTAFFELLANRQFPAATFIRRREDFDYLEEPDIFHEVFGHTPLLTDRRFAAFAEAFGKVGLAADARDHAMLARLYWFTVEFGLMHTTSGLRSYGAGIISSPGELEYAAASDIPERRPFDPLDMLRTPYRIDIYQTVYFVIDSFDALYDLARADLMQMVRAARKLGMHAPTYPVKQSA